MRDAVHHSISFSRACRIVLTGLLLALSAFGVTASSQDTLSANSVPHTLSVKFIFRRADTSIDLGYMDNISRFLAFGDTLTSLRNLQVQALRISSSASPEGTLEMNEQLVQDRAKSIRKLMQECYPKLFLSLVNYSVVYDATDWFDITSSLASSSIIGRDEALRVIDTYGPKAGDYDGSRLIFDSLKAIANGSVWEEMNDFIFPSLRSATLTIIYTSSGRIASAGTQEAVNKPNASDTSIGAVLDSAALEAAVRRILASGNYAIPDSLASTTAPAVEETKTKPVRSKHPFMALKTNLLFDAATIVNFELEFPIKNHVSINLEGWCPWWIFYISGNYYALQLMQASLEVRYWFGNRTKHPLLEGWFLGVYGGAAYYDFEWKNRGIQGESYINAGLSAGYSFEIAKNWRLETSLSVGYAHNDYRDYIHRTDLGLLIWQADHTYDWIGPTKLKCSISWLIPGYPKEKKNGTKDKAQDFKNLNEKGGIQ